MDKEEMEWKESKPAVANKSNEIKIAQNEKNGAAENGIPAGLEALVSACRQIYPDQLNPLQVTALVKFWLGGPDPLDYISMYEVAANPKLNIPPHWHYVSFGLSDIHGDGRVHEFTGPNQPSGFGFELSLRLKREPTDKGPPTWPAAIMQGLAKYVFQSESLLCVGDHVSWHSPLDGSESRLQHMLMAADPRLGCVSTPNGMVQFVQIVGITSEELRAVQHWNGLGVIEIMKRSIVTGGPWLVNDMRRGESIYDIDPAVAEEVETGIENQGSNLSGVSAKVSWTSDNGCAQALPPQKTESAALTPDRVTCHETEQIRLMLKKGLQIANTSPSEKETITPQGSVDGPVEVINRLPSLDISINLESGALLPLALRGRLKHGRHFTFKSVLGNSALTFVAPGVSGTFVSPESPYCVRGGWLQVFIPMELLEKMSADLGVLVDPDEVKVPAVFNWAQHKLTIRVMPEEP